MKEFLNNENIIIFAILINAAIVIGLIIYVIHINKKYIKFMKKIGNGSNIDEQLRKYIKEVEDIKIENKQIENYYITLNNNIDSCIQKVGMVRYNAFADVGSDLSFALALLDRNNNGIILNGLYGSDSSNIYAKPIKDGISTYQLSEEEKEAISIAEQKKNFYTKKRNRKLYK